MQQASLFGIDVAVKTIDLKANPFEVPDMKKYIDREIAMLK